MLRIFQRVKLMINKNIFKCANLELQYMTQLSRNDMKMLFIANDRFILK